MIHQVNRKRPNFEQCSFSCLSILFFFLGSAAAQENYHTLMADGEVQTVNANGERFVDYIIPEQPGFNQLILEAVGADGGWIEYQYQDHFKALRSKRVSGGEGAIVTATYSVGHGGNLPSGSMLRFVIGTRGHWAKYDLLTSGGYGAGGGGGTAVLLSKDRGATWTLLMVAGGGGGAGVRFREDRDEIELNAGLPGISGEHGAGGQHHKQVMADGGMQGSGGQSYQSTGGGGGAFKDGEHLAGVLIHGNAGWKDFRLNEQPLGGLGGIPQEGYRGGWGFGGGGSGLEGGGGGGGYSGGGAGMQGYGGGGGGSYVNQTSIFPTNVEKVENGNTNNTGDGFIRYKCINN
ncbi:MAG: glycine-rich protein [Saprospiraceae bacterium]